MRTKIDCCACAAAEAINPFQSRSSGQHDLPRTQQILGLLKQIGGDGAPSSAHLQPSGQLLLNALVKGSVSKVAANAVLVLGFGCTTLDVGHEQNRTQLQSAG